MQSQSNENAPNMQPNPASDFEYQIDPNENVATIVKFLNYQATACVVPAEIKGSRVVKIGNGAFSNRRLQAITLPDGLKTIGDHAFYHCNDLQTVTLPDGLKTIGDHAFYHCQALQAITLPDGLKDVGRYAFGYCQALRIIAFPGSRPRFGDYAFNGCYAVRVVASPNGQTGIPNLG
ncbi:MAG: leucine-rich repeat domain-containing protein, partial [Thermoguttaceae bacterium]|nr:leucine-rich repeat domain-containing protein [Thermoguttaceae bacterium]